MQFPACIITLMRFAITLLFLLLPLCAQPPQAPPKKGGGGPPKNLKILTPEDMRAGVMRQYTQALGVTCDHCHVPGGDRASDDNPKKDVARMMIGMVHDINGKFPDAKEHVTCYTCHRGKVAPETAPAPPAAQ
jgi:hypothetical protein